MNSNTKIFKLVNQFTIQSKKKLWIFQKIVTISIFALFLGFICGNIFGTFLNFFRNFFKWDGLIIFLTILLIEFINYLTFKKINNKEEVFNNQLKTKIDNKSNPIKNTKNLKAKMLLKPLNQQDKKKIQTNVLSIVTEYNFIKVINFYKIGLLLGFFIDAFKVGS